MQAVGETEDIITAFENAPNAGRRAFAIHVLFRRRPE